MNSALAFLKVVMLVIPNSRAKKVPTGARMSTSMRRSSELDRKSTRLNSSHDQISYAVFCLKKKNDTSTVKGRRATGDDPVLCRTPLGIWGGSLRGAACGLRIMRLDYTKPLDRSLWQL